MKSAPMDSLLFVGQLERMAWRLDVDSLEQFLASPPEDFRYVRQCRAAIDFRNALFPSEKSAASAVKKKSL
jgi:hypothetical protein